jgi:hypothetical protein
MLFEQNILSGANCSFGWCHCIFDLCRWWRSAKQIGFPPGFVLDVDAVLAKNGGASAGVNPRKEPLKT